MFKLNSEGNIIVDPSLLMIPEFNKIWVSDLDNTKSNAFAIFSYIYFLCDYKSPYNSYGLEKEEFIIRDFFKDKNIDVKSPDILAAIQKYNELKKIPEIHVLEATREGLLNLAQYIKTPIEGKNSAAIAASIQKNIDTVAKSLAGFATIRETVEKEIGKQGKKIGQEKTGMYEE